MTIMRVNPNFRVIMTKSHGWSRDHGNNARPESASCCRRPQVEAARTRTSSRTSYQIKTNIGQPSVGDWSDYRLARGRRLFCCPWKMKNSFHPMFALLSGHTGAIPVAFVNDSATQPNVGLKIIMVQIIKLPSQ